MVIKLTLAKSQRGTGEAGVVRGGEALQDASWCLENQQTHFNKGFVST